MVDTEMAGAGEWGAVMGVIAATVATGIGLSVGEWVVGDLAR